jgi:hypothetical protein
MTESSQALSSPNRIGTPLNLIFYGIIIVMVDLILGNFDTINDFVGMLLIFWGVIALSRVPISGSYQRWMKFLTFIADTNRKWERGTVQ